MENRVSCVGVAASSVFRDVQQERRRLTSQLEGLNNALSALRAVGHRRARMSAAGGVRIAAAQRLRWSKVNDARCPPAQSLASEPLKKSVGQIGGDNRRSVKFAHVP